MPAPQRYPTPAAQLAILAQVARLDGVPFDEFWVHAVRPRGPVVTTRTPAADVPVGCVRWPADSLDSRIWRDAMAGTKDGWERAYAGFPATRNETALARLQPLLAALEAQVLHPDDREPLGLPAVSLVA